MIYSKTWKAKSIQYLKQTHEHVSLVKELPNTTVQPNRVPRRRNNFVNDDKSIRSKRNLIHRMISSKTTQKPASTAWYPVLSRSTQDCQIEPATRDNLDWLEFGYGESMTCLPCYELKPNLTNLDWAKRVLHEFKHESKTQSNTR